MYNKCYGELKLRLNTPKKLLNRLPFNLVLYLDYNLHSDFCGSMQLLALFSFYSKLVSVVTTVKYFKGRTITASYC